MEAEELIIDLIGNIFGEPKMINEIRGQISVDCPVCSYTIKGLDKLDGKGNLEINYQGHVYKCWACAETHGTHGHLGKLIDKFGSKKDKKIYTHCLLESHKLPQLSQIKTLIQNLSKTQN